MKRILFICCLLTATCAGTYQQADAQATYTGTVTASGFTDKVNQMDAYIASGDMTNAQATWNIIHSMMMAEFGVTKSQIASAATAADKATYTTKHNTQYSFYKTIWGLKTDLATNRAAIHTALLNYAGTI